MRLHSSCSRLLALAFVTVASSVLAPSLARAQAAAVAVLVQNKDSLPRVDTANGGVTKRVNVISREGINLSDCRSDQSIQFPVTLAGQAPTDNVEVWATDQGADCGDPARRQNIAPFCYQLKNASFALQLQQTVQIKVKDIIRGDPATAVDDKGCRLLNLSTVTVYFLLYRGGPTTVAAAKDTVPIKVDTIGPRPLSNVRAKPGNNRIEISWDSVGEGGTDDVVGAQAFCDPSPAPASASDAGTSEVCVDASADADDTGATPEPTCTTVANEGGAAGDPIPQAPNIDSSGKACSTTPFAKKGGKSIVPDEAFSAKYSCGSVSGSTGNTIVVSGASDGKLVNGRTYAVTVAATDSFDNVGEIADGICQFPEETSDFWREYRTAGGEAGGGFCSVEGAGAPAGSFGLVVVAGAVAIRSLRRRAKRSAEGARCAARKRSGR